MPQRGRQGYPKVTPHGKDDHSGGKKQRKMEGDMYLSYEVLKFDKILWSSLYGEHKRLHAH